MVTLLGNCLKCNFLLFFALILMTRENHNCLFKNCRHIKFLSIRKRNFLFYFLKNVDMVQWAAYIA